MGSWTGLRVIDQDGPVGAARWCGDGDWSAADAARVAAMVAGGAARRVYGLA
jgi:hypothetical protein